MSGGDAALGLAFHYLAIDQPRRALDVLEGIAGPDLEDPRLWEVRTQALVDLERYAEAVDAAREGLRSDADSSALLYLLATAEAELGRLGEAEEAILAALKLEPEHPALLCCYAHLLARGGELAKAARVLAEAERVDPDDPAVLRCRIALAYLRGDDKAAERESRRLLAENPDDPAGHTMLGARAASRGRARAASRYFDTAARYDLGDEEAVALARRARIEAHPLFWPILPFVLLGPAKSWLVAMATIAVLAALDLGMLAFAFAMVYVLLCVYSWVVPPLAGRWLGRRHR